MACNTRKRTLGHLCILSSQIKLRSPRGLIRDGTLRLHWILCYSRFNSKQNHMCVKDRRDMTLAVKVKPQYNQPTH